LLVLVLAIPVFASGTRVASMGEIRFGDSSEVGMYPGLRTKWSNYIAAGMNFPGIENDYTGGVIFDLGPGVFALAMNGNAGMLDLNGNPLKTNGITYGLSLGAIDLGANFTYGADKMTVKEGDDTDTDKHAFMGFGVGASNDMIDIGIGFSMMGETQTFEISPNEDADDITESGYMFALNGRFLPMEFGKFNVIPEIIFQTDKYSLPDDQIVTSHMQFALNTFIKYNLTENTKTLMEIQVFNFEVETDDFKNDTIDPVFDKLETKTIAPFTTFKVGVESNIKPWLIGRFGAVKDCMSGSLTQYPWVGDEVSVSGKATDFRVTFGLGIKFGKFLLDMNVNEELLFEGPNFITGGQHDWASALALKYYL
jgi:hypothetical protein